MLHIIISYYSICLKIIVTVILSKVAMAGQGLGRHEKARILLEEERMAIEKYTFTRWINKAFADFGVSSQLYIHTVVSHIIMIFI